MVNEDISELLDQFNVPNPGRFTASSAAIVDPATIVAEVFNVDFTLDSPSTLLTQLRKAIPLQGEKVRRAKPQGTTTPAGPFAATFLAAQVLQENVALLAGIQPIEPKKGDGCDHRTVVPLIVNSVTAIVQELGKREPPLTDRVDSELRSLCEYDATAQAPPRVLDADNVGGNLGLLRDRLGLRAKGCSVQDERSLSVFTNVVQFTNMVVQTWHTAKTASGPFLTTGTFTLQRSLRAIVLTAEQLRAKVPAAAWITSVSAGDLYQWIHGYASEGALLDLKRGGRDGIRKVNTTMSHIMRATETTLKPAAGATTIGCSAAFVDDDVQKIVDELLCHMDSVITVTGELTGQPA